MNLVPQRTAPWKCLAGSVLVAVGLGQAFAANSVLLDFGPTTAATPYLTYSPAHSLGVVPGTDTTWNQISSSAATSSLLYGNGAAATGLTLTLGQEATGGNNIIDFSTAIANLGLVGTGGSVAGQQTLLTAGSIYGDDTSSTAPGRDGIFGGGTATGTGAAIGLRLDGLSAGNYVIYVMARNVNSSGTSIPMNIFAMTGASSGTFDFSGLTAVQQSNIGYPSAGYSGQYNDYVAGENYVALSVSINEGESLFLAVDGANDAVERRGFLNSIVVTVPEPGVGSMALMGLGMLAIVFRKQRVA